MRCPRPCRARNATRTPSTSPIVYLSDGSPNGVGTSISSTTLIPCILYMPEPPMMPICASVIDVTPGLARDRCEREAREARRSCFKPLHRLFDRGRHARGECHGRDAVPPIDQRPPALAHAREECFELRAQRLFLLHRDLDRLDRAI